MYILYYGQKEQVLSSSISPYHGGAQSVSSLASQHGALQVHLPGKMSQLLLLPSLHSVLVPAPSQMWKLGLLKEKVGQRSFPSERTSGTKSVPTE